MVLEQSDFPRSGEPNSKTLQEESHKCKNLFLLLPEKKLFKRTVLLRISLCKEILSEKRRGNKDAKWLAIFPNKAPLSWRPRKRLGSSCTQVPYFLFSCAWKSTFENHQCDAHLLFSLSITHTHTHTHACEQENRVESTLMRLTPKHWSNDILFLIHKIYDRNKKKTLKLFAKNIACHKSPFSPLKICFIEIWQTALSLMWKGRRKQEDGTRVCFSLCGLRTSYLPLSVWIPFSERQI